MKLLQINEFSKLSVILTKTTRSTRHRATSITTAPFPSTSLNFTASDALPSR